jgi:hypothetical protein
MDLLILIRLKKNENILALNELDIKSCLFDLVFKYNWYANIIRVDSTL